jgi:hypothetical protein
MIRSGFPTQLRSRNPDELVPKGGVGPAHSGQHPTEPAGVRPDHWYRSRRRRSSVTSARSIAASISSTVRLSTRVQAPGNAHGSAHGSALERTARPGGLPTYRLCVKANAERWSLVVREPSANAVNFRGRRRDA